MARLKFELYVQPRSENGIGSSFTDGNGNETKSYWTAPPESIDHVDITYLQNRFPNIKTKRHVEFVKAEFKRQLRDNFREVKNNVYESVIQPDTGFDANNPVIESDNHIGRVTKLSFIILAQQGANFAAILYRDEKQIGGIGNDKNGFYIRLDNQPTVREMADIMLFAEKINPIFGDQPFTFSLIQGNN